MTRFCLQSHFIFLLHSSFLLHKFQIFSASTYHKNEMSSWAKNINFVVKLCYLLEEWSSSKYGMTRVSVLRFLSLCWLIQHSCRWYILHYSLKIPWPTYLQNSCSSSSRPFDSFNKIGTIASVTEDSCKNQWDKIVRVFVTWWFKKFKFGEGPDAKVGTVSPLAPPAAIPAHLGTHGMFPYICYLFTTHTFDFKKIWFPFFHCHLSSHLVLKFLTDIRQPIFCYFSNPNLHQK